MDNREPLAQQVEHRPFKPGVLGSSPRRLTFLSHTADSGFFIQGDTPEEVVFWSIYALFAVILGQNYLETVPLEGRKTKRDIELTSEDLALALHDLLEELLYQFDSHGLVPVEAEEILVDVNEVRIRAVVRVRRLSPKREDINEVKAITYHRLRFEKKGGLWEAEVILDM